MTAAVLLAVLLVGLSWAGGGFDPWARTLMGAAIVCGCAILACFRPVASSRFDRSLRRASAIALATLLLYVVCQAANPSHLLPAGNEHLQPRAHLAWLPHSVYAPGTWRALLTVAAAALCFWIAAYAVPRTRHLGLLVLLGGNAFLLAVGAMLTRPVTGASRLAMGPFVNENSYAAYANLLLPVVLACGAEWQARAKPNRGHPGYLLYFVAACLLASVAVSESRAGLAIGVMLMLAWLIQEGRRLAMQRLTRSPQAVLVPAGMAVVLLLLVGAGIISRHLESLSGPKWQIAIEMRTLAAQGTWRLFCAHPGYGIGAGAFAQAFPYYQPEALTGYFRFAHNDWLQLLAEWGVVGALLVLLALGINAAPLWRNRAYLRHDRLADGLILSLAGVALHAAVDFPLQVPAVFLLAATWAGLLCGRAGAREGEADCPSAPCPN